MSHEPKVWSLAEIAASIEPENSSVSYFVQIPKFQRSIVWTDSQITKLVDSIYKGFPIGSLLAYQTDQVRGSKPVLQLVDGLQRVTAIARFMAAPLKYAPLEELVSADYVAACAELVFGDTHEKNLALTEQRFKTWFDSRTELSYGEQFSFFSLAKHLADGDSSAEDRLIASNKSDGAGERLLGKVLKDQEEARRYRVPINIYSGLIENVPTVFERINSQGAKLSKYEILAASWIHTSVNVDNQAVIQAIADKYRVMISNGYEVDGFDEDSVESSDYNLYEYLFGLGKVLANSFPTLFHSSDAADDDSPVAFQIFTVALELTVAKMGTLAERMPRLASGEINVSRIEKAVFEACAAADHALGQFLTLRLNEQATGPSGVGQNQAISMVTSILANCFDREFQNFDAKRSAQIAANIPAHFLLDVLRNSWGNAGDSTLFDRTWEPNEPGENGVGKLRGSLSPSAHYLKPVDAESLKTAFNLWHSTQLDAKQRERARFAKDTKPVLKFIYSTLLTPQEDKGVRFELEHVYPVAVLKRLIVERNLDGLPMAAIGNLMLLPKDINRIKGEHLLGDYILNKTQSELPKRELERLQSFLISPDLEDVSLEQGVDSDNFRVFCEARADAMILHLIESLGLS